MARNKAIANLKLFRKPDRSRLEDVFLLDGDPQKYIFEGISKDIYEPPKKEEKFIPDTESETEPLIGDDLLEDIIKKKLIKLKEMEDIKDINNRRRKAMAMGKYELL